MLDDFDMNIQCDECFNTVDEYTEYYGLWSDRFEDPRYLDEES